jgi:hypothetical protein
LFETHKAIETQINNRNTKTNIDLTKLLVSKQDITAIEPTTMQQLLQFDPGED